MFEFLAIHPAINCIAIGVLVTIALGFLIAAIREGLSAE